LKSSSCTSRVSSHKAQPRRIERLATCEILTITRIGSSQTFRRRTSLAQPTKNSTFHSILSLSETSITRKRVVMYQGARRLLKKTTMARNHKVFLGRRRTKIHQFNGLLQSSRNPTLLFLGHLPNSRRKKLSNGRAPSSQKSPKSSMKMTGLCRPLPNGQPSTRRNPQLQPASPK